MSMYIDQPFNETEERYFLAEILKKSTLSTLTLTALIRDAGIEPAWTEIALPNGRSVSSCQYAYSNLLQRSQQQQQQQQHAGPPLAQLAAQQRTKRPYSMGDAITPIAREIQPRPPTFSSFGQPPNPSPLAMSPVEPPRKKRGRPTKSEREARQAEAISKGEIWPKPRKKPKGRRFSEGTGEEASMAASRDTGAAEDSAGAALPGSSARERSAGPAAIMSPHIGQNLGPHLSPTAPRMQDIMRPTEQAHGDNLRANAPTRAEMPFYQPASSSSSSPVVPRIPGLPRMTGAGALHMQPYSPQLLPQYHSKFHMEDRPPGSHQ